MKKLNKEKQNFEALLEMHQAGFLDAYNQLNNERKTKKWWGELNRRWRIAFKKRFEKKLDKELNDG